MARPTAATAQPPAASALEAAAFFYHLLRAPARATLQRLFGLAVEGLEHLPESGAYILAANHHNYLDGVVLGVTVPRPIAFLVMPRVWRATPIHPLFHRHIGSIPVDLDRPDPGAVRRALDALAAGRVVGIFPEGPFSVRGRLERGLPGVGLLALHSGVPVVPVGIRGTYEALVDRRFYIPRRHPLVVRFGPTRRFATAAFSNPRVARREVTERIMSDIAGLLG